MRLPRRRPKDADLRSWLTTGAPARIEKMLDDPRVAARLEELTALRPQERATLDAAVTPAEGFRERTQAGVHRRVSDLERARAIFDLLGLGAQTARTLLTGDERDERDDA